MTININNQLKDVPDESTISFVLDQCNITLKGIAIAVNNQIVTKSLWQTTALKDRDQITIIQATQGG